MYMMTMYVDRPSDLKWRCTRASGKKILHKAFLCLVEVQAQTFVSKFLIKYVVSY
jgi:hypothetical protein